MKFLHTADWQIGMKASSLGETASRVREERLAAGQRVIEAAKANDADFILLAGDTFEDNGVDRGLVQKVADILDSFKSPVFILPGNHDPLIPGSVWEHPAWKLSSNLNILKEEIPVVIEGGFLYPCPVREKHSQRNPTAWISPSQDDGVHIGLAHGSVEGIFQDEPDYPIPRNAAQGLGLDYLALGHWHSCTIYDEADSASRMAYSGTHETTKFGERDSGNVLVIEIANRGTPPVITPVRTGGFEWMSIEKELREPADLIRLKEQIEAVSNASGTLIEITLQGIMRANNHSELEHLEQILDSRFLWKRMDVSRLKPSPEDESWLSRLPPGILYEAAVRLQKTSDPSVEVATRALIELYAIMEEVAP